MDTGKILSVVDHTLLSRTATWQEIKAVLDDAVLYKTASACIPASFVKKAKEYVGKNAKICTVIGFPNGYSTVDTKVFETADAVKNGADEIDMVINIGMLKEKRYNYVLNEIKSVRNACSGKILKVIIETCLLTVEEKIKMCEIVSVSGADYIKTSTGFAGGGATKEDIILFSNHISNGVKIKAAGGVKTLSDAAEFINLGAERLGTSRIVNLIKDKENNNEKLSDTAY